MKYLIKKILSALLDLVNNILKLVGYKLIHGPYREKNLSVFIFYKKVILSHYKNLNRGEILIDDRPNNGAKNFKGEWIHFATDDFPDWASILQKLIN